MAGNAVENVAGNLGGLFANPGVKAAIGGIASSAVQQLMQQYGPHR
jgi:hypothetical protein